MVDLVWSSGNSASNVHDSHMLEATMDSIPPLRLPGGQRGRPRQRPMKLHADKGYDFKRCRHALRQRGIITCTRAAGHPDQASDLVEFAEWWNGHCHGSTVSAGSKSAYRAVRKYPSGLPLRRLLTHLLASASPMLGLASRAGRMIRPEHARQLRDVAASYLDWQAIHALPAGRV